VKRRKILLAEDNAVNQTITVKMLTKIGHAVTVANNGHEALEAWDKGYSISSHGRANAEMDGSNAPPRFACGSSRPAATQPIIALTAHALKVTTSNALTTHG